MAALPYTEISISVTDTVIPYRQYNPLLTNLGEADRDGWIALSQNLSSAPDSGKTVSSMVIGKGTYARWHPTAKSNKQSSIYWKFRPFEAILRSTNMTRTAVLFAFLGTGGSSNIAKSYFSTSSGQSTFSLPSFLKRRTKRVLPYGETQLQTNPRRSPQCTIFSSKHRLQRWNCAGSVNIKQRHHCRSKASLRNVMIQERHRSREASGWPDTGIRHEYSWCKRKNSTNLCPHFCQTK